jgi:hypothetical protein
MISSIPEIPDAYVLGRAIGQKSEKLTPVGCARNIGRTRVDFQSRVQAINGLLRLRLPGRRNGSSWQRKQAAASQNRTKKGRREAGLFAMLSLR